MAYAQVNRAQFRALLDERLGALASTFYRVDEKNKYIQESLRFFNLLTGFWKTKVTLLTISNKVWYQLPYPIVVSPLRVTWQSQPLSPASIYDMGFGRANWKTENTTTGGDVPTSVKLFIVGALNLVAIWPQDSAGNSQLDIDGIAATPILISDSSILDIGQEEMKILLDYCEHVALMKQGGVEFAQSEALVKSFLKAAGERSAILRACATWRKYMGLDRQRYQVKMQNENAEPGAR